MSSHVSKTATFAGTALIRVSLHSNKSNWCHCPFNISLYSR